MFSERSDLAGGGTRVTSRSRARRWYGDANTDRDRAAAADYHPEAGEWDDPARHRALLEQLLEDYDGWAIATTPDGLSCYEPLPIPARVMAWVKPRAIPGNHRIMSTWEPVICYTPLGRRSRRTCAHPVKDVLTAAPPNSGFAGAKPAAWTRWVLDALGYDQETDELVDLFPGSGAVGREASQGVLLTDPTPDTRTKAEALREAAEELRAAALEGRLDLTRGAEAWLCDRADALDPTHHDKAVES